MYQQANQQYENNNHYLKEHARIIIVHGKAHSGKGEVAKYLVNNCGYTECGFADYLKQLATDTFGWSYELIHKNVIRTAESRTFMQTLGQAGRMFDEDFWVKILAARLRFTCMQTKAHAEANSLPFYRMNFVISDLRYVNEMDWGRKIGAKIWKVKRTGDFKKIQAGANHASEISLDNREDWDKVLVNDNTLTDFYGKIAAVMSTRNRA